MESRLTKIPPALLEAISEDPAAMEPVARAMAAVNLDNLFELMRDPRVNINARMEFQKLLNAMGRIGVNRDAPQNGSNFSVVINIPKDEKIIDVKPSLPLSG